MIMSLTRVVAAEVIFIQEPVELVAAVRWWKRRHVAAWGPVVAAASAVVATS